MIIAVTGGSGTIGKPVVLKLLEKPENTLKLLLREGHTDSKFLKRWKKQYGDRIRIVFGSIGSEDVCEELVKDADYVLHLAGVIPPKADHDEKLAWEVNYNGTMRIVDAIIKTGNTAKLVFFSTVAVYGYRGEQHHWGRVGDPLLPSVFDAYGASKICAERYILDSELNHWVILRETGVLHDHLMMGNIGDGLIFQPPPNMFIEWVTVHDTALLLDRIFRSGEEKKDFWNKVYNIGGGILCRQTGFESYDDGFKLIGGSAKKTFEPRWHNQRNFHCFWFSDSDVLEELFHFQTEGTEGFWNGFKVRHKIYSLGKIVPAGLIKALVLKPLLKNSNAPAYWVANNIEAKVIAVYGSMEQYEQIPMRWEDYDLICEHADYESMKTHRPEYDLPHGYDETKPDAEIGIADMQEAAAFRGGKVLSEKMQTGDWRSKLKWQCHNGHVFESSPYTVLKAGHWCPECCSPKEEWNFDELSKHIPFFAQVWYDTHAEDEDYLYYFDEQMNPCVRKIKDS